MIDDHVRHTVTKEKHVLHVQQHYLLCNWNTAAGAYLLSRPRCTATTTAPATHKPNQPPLSHPHLTFSTSKLSRGPLCPGGRNRPISFVSCGGSDPEPHFVADCAPVADASTDADVDDAGKPADTRDHRDRTNSCAYAHRRRSRALMSLSTCSTCAASLASLAPSRCCTDRSPFN